MVKSKGVWIIFATLLILFYFLFNPSESKFMPQCIFHKLTGLQCMGCGSQRMIHHLLHGEIGEAFRANAFVFCAIPLLIFFLWAEISRTRHPAIYSAIHSLPVIITSVVLLIVWFVARNIIGI